MESRNYQLRKNNKNTIKRKLATEDRINENRFYCRKANSRVVTTEAAGGFRRDPQKCLQSEQARKQKKWAGDTAKLCTVLWKGVVQNITRNSTDLEKYAQSCIFTETRNLNMLNPNKSIQRWIIIQEWKLKSKLWKWRENSSASHMEQ